jgi:pimeloyl-ACP methyl ester carboxylesterase
MTRYGDTLPGNIMKKIFLTLLFAVSALIANNSARAQNNEKMVDVANGKLHVILAGDGPYTVVFESGFMSDLSVWHKVAPNITKHAQILVYSRAGVGKSPARAQPLNLSQHTEELQQLIEALQIKTPIILVGHSYGGWVVRQHAARYPQKIAGLVLVDPANETLELELKKLDPQKVLQDQKRLENMAPPAAKADLALVQQIFDQAKLPSTTALPDVPMVILTSIQATRNNPFYQETAPALQVKRDLHAKLFQQFSNGAHIVTSHSGHHIQFDEPHLVIRAIEDVITNLDKEAQKQAKQLAKQKAKQALMQDLEKAGKEIAAKEITTATSSVNTALKASQFSEAEINQLGFDLMLKAKQGVLAEMVLAYNVTQFPQSDNAYDSHGEALLNLQRYEEARKQFQKALTLGKANPQRSPKALQGYQENLQKAEQALQQK